MLTEGLVELSHLSASSGMEGCDMGFNEGSCTECDPSGVRVHLLESSGRRERGERLTTREKVVVLIEGNTLDVFPSPKGLVEDPSIRRKELDVSSAEQRRAHDIDVAEGGFEARESDEARGGAT